MVYQLSDKNTDGTQLGQSATDLIGFYGKTPIVQPALTTTSTLSTNATVTTVGAAVNDIVALLKALGLSG